MPADNASRLNVADIDRVQAVSIAAIRAPDGAKFAHDLKRLFEKQFDQGEREPDTEWGGP